MLLHCLPASHKHAAALQTSIDEQEDQNMMTTLAGPFTPDRVKLCCL